MAADPHGKILFRHRAVGEAQDCQVLFLLGGGEVGAVQSEEGTSWALREGVILRRLDSLGGP